jgi:OOP family OmpA-OmpF porin
LITKLINGGYVATYFDFNKSTPTNVSTEGIDFILTTYLRNNLQHRWNYRSCWRNWRSDYNDKLSNARAETENILLIANIDASRLKVIAAEKILL